MDQAIELRHLRYFVAVAEELHFSRAAHRLHIAQPPLSQQIRKLEELLGYALFHRTSRTVSLTTAGVALLESARRTLRGVQRDIDDVRSVGRGETGSLHVGFVGSAMLTTLPGILRDYTHAYPRVRLHLHESYTAHVIDGMANGTLDAGILRDGDPVHSLDVISVYSEPYVAVLPASHPRAGEKSIAPENLRHDPLIYFSRSAGTRAFETPLSIFDKGGARPRIVQEASHWVTILQLVGAGLGISIAPACVSRLAQPEVVCLPLDGVHAVSHIEMALHKNEERPLVRQFAKIVKGAAASSQAELD